MKIAIVHSFYSSSIPSGENTVVQMQVDALRNAGHTVELIGVHTDRLATGRFYKLRTGVNVAAGLGVDPLGWLERFAPDVVHIHNLFPNFGTHWLARCTFPVVATIHNFRPMCAAGTLFRDGRECTLCPSGGQQHAVVHACYKESRVATAPIAIRNVRGLRRDPLLSRADELIFLSDRSLATYKNFGLPELACSILPNFVHDSEHRRTQAGSSWLYAGRLTEEKGIIDLLRFWPREVQLTVLGDGPCMSEAKVVAGPEVTLEGSVSHDVVLNSLKSAAGLVLPSRWAEGLPTVYLEALAAGVPVVARAGNSAADDIALYGHGVVYTHPEDLPAALDTAQGLRERLAAAAYAQYQRKYTVGAWQEGILKIYDAAIKKQRDAK